MKKNLLLNLRHGGKGISQMAEEWRGQSPRLTYDGKRERLSYHNILGQLSITVRYEGKAEVQTARDGDK